VPGTQHPPIELLELLVGQRFEHRVVVHDSVERNVRNGPSPFSVSPYSRDGRCARYCDSMRKLAVRTEGEQHGRWQSGDRSVALGASLGIQ
jgi:hypothetical protein